MTLGKSFRVYHCTSNENNSYSVLLEQRNKNEALLFEAGYIKRLNLAATEACKKIFTRLPDAYGCLGILQLTQGEAFVQYLLLVNSCLSAGKVLNSEIFRITETNFISLRNNPQDIERIQEVRKVLNSGTFYFSWSSSGVPLDLTLCEQRSQFGAESDNRFFWNKTMHISFIRNDIDCQDWLLKVICGGIEIRTIYVGHLQARGCIISRLSSERAGTRFNVRGTNDEGCVANFVETEQVIYLENKVCSYVQIRGSVPLFWEQPGLQVGSHKVKLSRGPEASAPSYDRHLTQIVKRYGDQVLINLLGSKEGEAMLSKMFQNHHKVSRYSKSIPYIAFDYHAQCRGGKQENIDILKRKIASNLENFGFFYKDPDGVHKCQKGTFRTNCLDCLDRTNNVQTFIGLEVLKQQLKALGISDQPQIISRFNEVFKQMWIQNGDQVSKMYAGTGALEGKSKLKDGSRSVVRTIQNNLLDSSKQEAIDILLLGDVLYNEIAERARCALPPSMLSLPPGFLETFLKRKSEFTNTSKITVGVATWNVNGGKHFNSIVFKHQSMTEWLLDCPKLSKSKDLIQTEEENRVVDIYAIGFEEIVDLNASNIVSASSQNQKEWMVELQKTISRDHKYIYITSTQLVGVCLFLFALPKHAPYISDVAIDAVKTGFGGATGNKGAVAIRMALYNTSMCFVCAHFAAGQSQVLERNADYQEISKRLSFPLGRTLDSHDYVFWCGDFNYRIDLTNDEVKKLVKAENWAALLAADQLLNSQQSGQAFKDFIEAPINFAPTYKYDIFSDDYDTSEKNRIPSWTDRVLFKRKKYPYDESESPGKIVFYGRAELKTSDHRPVIAYIDVEVLHVDGPKRLEVFQNLVASGPPDGTIVVQIQSEDTNLEENLRNRIVSKLCKGKIVQTRVVYGDIYVTFTEGKTALEALEYNNLEVEGCVLKVQLKMPDWSTNICKTLKLCQNNTTPLTSSYSKSNYADSPFSELGCSGDASPTHHDAVSELSKEVQKCLEDKTYWHGALEGYVDSDNDSAKSQPSSGRSSPIHDSSEAQKYGSAAKLPPRPPPPVKSAPPPKRPPPPQKLSQQTKPAEENSSKVQHPTSVCEEKPEKSVEIKETSCVEQNANYVSHPPPSTPPPPPPPNLDKHTSSRSSPAKSEVSKPVVNAAVPPPIPSRPSLSTGNKAPPPLPARPQSNLPPVSPRKTLQ
ncbi:synaptojanin-1-like [Argiope bruennichi]|uniref:phosphoinositide 5-phosphatase n=1 Tax=Argiope bruennichi TaxID=94029 RepID=A0A8T0FNN1_ARGBR|nr:synaptojanin-1-like [Argiope bruennichi]KAF8790383.1 Synaptojanin-1 like protein [Argiope bruennichi]